MCGRDTWNPVPLLLIPSVISWLVALLRGTTGSATSSINRLEDIWSCLHETLGYNTQHNGSSEALHENHWWDWESEIYQAYFRESFILDVIPGERRRLCAWAGRSTNTSHAGLSSAPTHMRLYTIIAYVVLVEWSPSPCHICAKNC